MVKWFGPGMCAVALLLLLPASVRADARAEARRHFQEGMTLVKEGKYEEGTAELYEAYRILPHPAVLYNIGRAFFDAGRYERAIEELERYIESDPPDREDAERLLASARERLRAHEEPAAPETPARAPAAPGTAEAELALVRKQLARAIQQLEVLEGTGPPARAQDGGDGAPAARVRRQGPSPAEGGAPTDRISRGSAPADDPYAPIVITSSRYGQSTLDAPNSITIVTGEELRASGVTSIPDFLRRVPGVDVMANSPGDYNVGLRGFNDRLSNKVLVLVDGRSLFFDLIGATFWPLLTVSASDVERIEIVRGPGASLYGANAFSGVINIITRTPGQGAPLAEVWGGFPEQGGASLRLSDRAGATAYRASFSVERKRRWYNEIDPERPDFEVEAPHPDDAVRVGRADVRLDHRLRRDASVSVSGGIVGGQIEFLLTSSLPAARASGVTDLYADGYQTYLRGDVALPHGLSLRTYWQHTDFEINQWARPVGALKSDSRPITDVIDLEAQSLSEVDFGVVQRINLGAAYRFKTARWEFLGSEPDEHHVSVFFQDEAILSERLHAIFSLRLDRHPLLVDIEDAPLTDRYAFSPRAALVWRVMPGHALHATAGTAFRTPTFFESYTSIPLPTTTDAVVVRNTGNPNLLPERIFATELGWRSEPASSRYRLEATAYYNRVSSLIQISELRAWPADEPNYDPDGGVWYAGETSYINADDDYDAIGLEVGAKLFPIDGLDLYTSATYETIQQGDRDVDSTPPFKLSAGAQARRGPFQLSADLHFVSRQSWPLISFDEAGQIDVVDVELPSYVWAGARCSYLIPDTRLELAVAGENLLAELRGSIAPAAGDSSQVATPQGTHREYPLGQPVPTSVHASLTYRFW